MNKRARSLGVLLVLMAVILAAGIPVQAQGSLEEDTPTEDTWQSIMYLYQQGGSRYYEYKDTTGNAHLYERDEDDDWNSANPVAPTTSWKRIYRLWDQGENAYFAFFEDAAPGLRGFIYKLENDGSLSNLTPVPPPAMNWQGFEFLEEIDGKGHLNFCATTGCALMELDDDTFTVMPIQPPATLHWTEIVLLARAGTTRYFRFKDSSGNQHLHDEEETTTRQAEPRRVAALPDRTPPGGPWKLIEFLEEHNGKRYFHLKDDSDNNYVRALDGDTWDPAADAPGIWQERCVLDDLFHIYTRIVTPGILQTEIHRLESGSLVEKTPAAPAGRRWTEILCYGDLDGKGYLGLLEDSGGAHLYEEDNGTLTDLTPALSTWKETEALGPLGRVKYFRSKDKTSDEERVYRRKSVVSRSQTQSPQVEELEDITPTGTWKRIAYQTELANKDYLELVDKSTAEAHLYRLDDDNWQDLTPEAPAAAKWKSILFLLDQDGQTYYEFLDDSDEAHFYEVDDSSDVARPVRIDHENRDLTPSGKWRRMRFIRTRRHKAVFRFDDDSQNARFFELTQSGTVVIEKATLPSGGSGFSFLQDVDASGDFPLNDGQSKTFSSIVPGQYIVTEQGPPHSPGPFDLTGLACVDSDPQGTASTTDLGQRKATINLDPGETVTCTYTNTERGTIIIKKETKPGGGGGFQFSQNVDCSGDFGLNDGQSITHYHVLPGQYAVTEHDPLVQPGHYDLSGLVCQDSDPQGIASTGDLESRTATINVDPGETVTCTFTNTERGTAVLQKLTLPPDSEQEFPFEGLFDTELEDEEMVRQRVKPGSYTVTELVPEGWDLTDITCSDSNSEADLETATATYRVHAGEQVTCIFTNTQRGKITVKKETAPAGAAQAFAFSGAIDASLKDGAAASKKVKPGTYQVTEALPDDWKLTSINCDDRNSQGDKSTGTATFKVKPGEHVTCTFANTHDDVDDPPGTVVVAQESAPVGDATVYTYTGDAAGQLADGQRIVQGGLKAGTYTAQQLVPEGSVLTAIQCDDGESNGDIAAATATFRLQAGETVVCTFADLRLYHAYLPLVLR